jgi:chitinase
MSPGHQNPAEAPPNPTEDLELSADSGVSLDQYYKDAQNATESSAGVTPNKSGLSRRSLEKRGDGPLYCKDRKCPDERQVHTLELFLCW